MDTVEAGEADDDLRLYLTPTYGLVIIRKRYVTDRSDAASAVKTKKDSKSRRIFPYGQGKQGETGRSVQVVRD